MGTFFDVATAVTTGTGPPPSKFLPLPPLRPFPPPPLSALGVELHALSAKTPAARHRKTPLPRTGAVERLRKSTWIVVTVKAYSIFCRRARAPKKLPVIIALLTLFRRAQARR